MVPTDILHYTLDFLEWTEIDRWEKAFGLDKITYRTPYVSPHGFGNSDIKNPELVLWNMYIAKYFKQLEYVNAKVKRIYLNLYDEGVVVSPASSDTNNTAFIFSNTKGDVMFTYEVRSVTRNDVVHQYEIVRTGNSTIHNLKLSYAINGCVSMITKRTTYDNIVDIRCVLMYRRLHPENRTYTHFSTILKYKGCIIFHSTNYDTPCLHNRYERPIFINIVDNTVVIQITPFTGVVESQGCYTALSTTAVVERTYSAAEDAYFAEWTDMYNSFDRVYNT